MDCGLQILSNYCSNLEALWKLVKIGCLTLHNFMPIFCPLKLILPIQYYSPWWSNELFSDVLPTRDLPKLKFSPSMNEWVRWLSRRASCWVGAGGPAGVGCIGWAGSLLLTFVNICNEISTRDITKLLRLLDIFRQLIDIFVFSLIHNLEDLI